MYKCRYTFWDDKNFPGFREALSDLYDRSIANYLYDENHPKKDHKRDLDCITKIFPLLEYYYVSLIKLGFVDKKNYFNILNNLKNIDYISILIPGNVRGVVVNNKVFINSSIKPFDDFSGDDMLKLTVFHELGHILNNGWSMDVEHLCSKLFNNKEVQNKLRNYGICSKNDLVNGFILLEDVIVEEAAEEVFYRSKETERPPFMYYKSLNFPGVQYRSNYVYYKMFQELALKFFRCLKTCDCFQEKTVTSALKKCCIKAFGPNFIKNIDSEISSDNDSISDFALLLGCLGKIKNANYSDFGLGIKSDEDENSYYYNLFSQAVNSRIIRTENIRKHIY